MFENIKVGDIVAIVSVGVRGDTITKKIVDSVTSKQFKVGGKTFRKTDGREIGRGKYSYDEAWLYDEKAKKLIQEEQERIARANKQRKLKEDFNALNLSALSSQELQSLSALVASFIKEQN